MTDITDLLTNTAYGYPRGTSRRIPARRLICIHVTANPNSPPATAQQERDYANRAGSNGPSAHSYLNRDGSFVHAIDPARYAAWSNGAIRSPKTTTPGISDVVELDGKTVPGTTETYNPNEDYYREVETCGRYSAYPITLAQRESLARIIAEDAITTGLRINRSTVHLHSDLDTEQRPNCPVPAASGEVWVAEIIARANQIYLGLKESNMTWDELLAAIDAEYKRVVAENAALVETNTALVNSLAVAKAKATDIETLANEIRSLP